VNFVYKQYPLPATMHPQALPAAKASLAAARQGKFWEMHDKIFASIREINADNLKKWAGEIGLDVPRWEKDMASPEVQREIDQDMQVARQAEVTGTPTFFVNGKRVMNRSFDGFKAMIEAALAEKGEKKG
jgi:protein-disulfide isomerase